MPVIFYIQAKLSCILVDNGQIYRMGFSMAILIYLVP